MAPRKARGAAFAEIFRVKRSRGTGHDTGRGNGRGERPGGRGQQIACRSEMVMGTVPGSVQEGTGVAVSTREGTGLQRAEQCGGLSQEGNDLQLLEEAQ